MKKYKLITQCSYCRKYREYTADPKIMTNWTHRESIDSDLTVSHGICPDCEAKLKKRG